MIVTDDEGAQAGSVKFDKKNDNSINIDRLKVKKIFIKKFNPFGKIDQEMLFFLFFQETAKNIILYNFYFQF